MIPKLICWLFGHKITYQDKVRDVVVSHMDPYTRVTGNHIEPIFKLKYYKTCPRCGKDLTGK